MPGSAGDALGTELRGAQAIGLRRVVGLQRLLAYGSGWPTDTIGLRIKGPGRHGWPTGHGWPAELVGL